MNSFKIIRKNIKTKYKKILKFKKNEKIDSVTMIKLLLDVGNHYKVYFTDDEILLLINYDAKQVLEYLSRKVSSSKWGK